MPHRPAPTARPLPIRGIAALAGALVGGLVAALVLVAAPAQGQVAVPVNCSNGTVVLEWDDTTYDVDGTCGIVKVHADNTVVDMPSATRLVVRGQGNQVVAHPVDNVRVFGHDNRVELPSTRVLRLASPGSVVAVEGLVEVARLGRHGATLTADRIADARISGRGHDVRARRGVDAQIDGNRNQLALRRLDALVVVGDRNRVTVRRGETRVDVEGTGNRIRVARRA